MKNVKEKKHTRAYYEKRGIKYSECDLTQLERFKIRLEKQGKTYNQFRYEQQKKEDDELNDWIDFVKAVDMAKEGWDICYSTNDKYYKTFKQIKEKISNGEDAIDEDYDEF